MFIERLTLVNFRCFGPEPLRIDMTSGLTTFVGVNGAGKTAVMQAFQRLFGITGDQRRLRRQDFHVPANELSTPLQRTFILEVVLAFPELEFDDGDDHAIPEFFHQMASDEAGRLKCRLRLEGTWTDDGSIDGMVEQKYWAVGRIFAENDRPRHLSGSGSADLHAHLNDVVEQDRAWGSLGGVEQGEVDSLAHRAAIDHSVIADLLDELTQILARDIVDRCPTRQDGPGELVAEPLQKGDVGAQLPDRSRVRKEERGDQPTRVAQVDRVKRRCHGEVGDACDLASMRPDLGRGCRR